MNARNLPAAAKSAQPPEMPTVEKHRVALSPIPTYREGSNGELIDSVDWSIHVSRYDLIPEADCQRIIAEVDAATMPASREIAARLAKLLCCSYPAREMADPEIFARMLSSVFEEAPEDIGMEAVDRITKQCRFLPSRAEVYEVTSGLMARRQHARLVAQQHIEMHEELERERAEEARRRAELEELHPYLRIVHQWEKRLGRGREVTHPRWRLGVVESEWRAAVERWVAAFGLAEVERWHQAIADLPKSPACGIQAELERLAGEAEKAAGEPGSAPR